MATGAACGPRYVDTNVAGAPPLRTLYRATNKLIRVCAGTADVAIRCRDQSCWVIDTTHNVMNRVNRYSNISLLCAANTDQRPAFAGQRVAVARCRCWQAEPLGKLSGLPIVAPYPPAIHPFRLPTIFNLSLQCSSPGVKISTWQNNKAPSTLPVPLCFAPGLT